MASCRYNYFQICRAGRFQNYGALSGQFLEGSEIFLVGDSLLSSTIHYEEVAKSGELRPVGVTRKF